RSLLGSGLEWLERRTGKPVFGVLSFLHGLALDAEDSLSTPEPASGAAKTGVFKIAVPVYPRISNHTDLDGLRWQAGVEVAFVRAGETLPPADLIVLAGSKSVRADL